MIRHPGPLGVVPVDALVSVVIPAHNEGVVIPITLDEVRRVVETCCRQWEIIVVDDGSKDNTFERASEISRASKSVRAIRLSRNFGKEAALLAGLQAARGRVVITMDADLQHPPSVIPELLAEWRAGAIVVNAVKRDRRAQGRMANAQARLFNAVFARLGGVSISDASDFKLLDRMVVDELVKSFPERKRFYRGLAEWVGYDQASVLFDVKERAAGKSNWSTMDLLRLAVSALISFSALPLRVVTALGAITLLLGLIIGVDTLLSWEHGEAVSGFATIIMTVLIIGSSIMISLGIIGEYIARIFYESKHRPIYLVASTVGFGEAEGRSTPTDESSVLGAPRG